MSRFTWDSYLTVADLLLDPGLPRNSLGGARRSAIRRAYYGAFHAVLAKVNAERAGTNEGALAETGKAHGEAMRALWGDGADRTRRRLSQQLDRLRSDRREADYDEFSALADRPDDATDAIEMARSIVAGVRRLT